MNDWVEGNGEWTKTVQYKNFTIVVHRPMLSAAEAAKRDRQIGDALEVYMKDYIARKGAL